MLLSFTYIPGENLSSDSIFTLILVSWSIIAYFTFYWGLFFIFYKDSKTTGFGFKSFLKMLVVLPFLAFIVGPPILANAIGATFIVSYTFFSHFDNEIVVNYYTFSLFIILYSSYLIFLMKRTNEQIREFVRKPNAMFIGWDLLGFAESLDVETESRKEYRIRDSFRTMMIVYVLLNASLVPIVLLQISRLLTFFT